MSKRKEQSCDGSWPRRCVDFPRLAATVATSCCSADPGSSRALPLLHVSKLNFPNTTKTTPLCVFIIRHARGIQDTSIFTPLESQQASDNFSSQYHFLVIPIRGDVPPCVLDRWYLHVTQPTEINSSSKPLAHPSALATGHATWVIIRIRSLRVIAPSERRRRHLHHKRLPIQVWVEAGLATTTTARMLHNPKSNLSPRPPTNKPSIRVDLGRLDIDSRRKLERLPAQPTTTMTVSMGACVHHITRAWSSRILLMKWIQWRTQWLRHRLESAQKLRPTYLIRKRVMFRLKRRLDVLEASLEERRRRRTRPTGLQRHRLLLVLLPTSRANLQPSSQEEAV